MTDRIRIMLIEDHEMVRAGFQMLLEAQPDMEIVAQADSGEVGLALVDQFRPDVILLDISMPGMGGTETARILKSGHPEIKILAVTIHSSKAYLLEMLDAGADGYLPKRAAAQELVNAIRAVHAGRTYIFTGLIDALVEGYRTRTEEFHEDQDSEELTPRQRQVLRMIGDGMTSHRIAEELELSARTVDRHVENMMKRLGIHSRIELVKYAIREGLIEVSD